MPSREGVEDLLASSSYCESDGEEGYFGDAFLQEQKFSSFVRKLNATDKVSKWSDAGRSADVLEIFKQFGLSTTTTDREDEENKYYPSACFETYVREICSLEEEDDKDLGFTVSELAKDIRSCGRFKDECLADHCITDDQELVRRFLSNYSEGRFSDSYFYCFCRETIESDSHTWHCTVCGECRDWREWHCSGCDDCQYGLSFPCKTCQPKRYRQRMAADGF